MTEAQVRKNLDILGERRTALREARAALQADTMAGLESAVGVIPMTEAAERVGLNRSTVYEVYRGRSNRAA